MLFTIAPWDIAALGFVLCSIAYASVMGSDGALRLVVTVPLALFSSEALTNLVQLMLQQSTSVFDATGANPDAALLPVVRLVLLILLIVFLTTHSGIEVEPPGDTWYWRLCIAIVSGAVTGVVLLAALLTMATHGPILGMDAAVTAAALQAQSAVLRTVGQGQELWYALPALWLLCMGIVRRN